MAKVTYKSVIPNDKPQWLLNVEAAVERLARMMTLQGNDRDWHNLQMFIDAEIGAQAVRGNIRRDTSVKTELRTDEGKTVIHLFRNQMIIETFYIE